MLSIALGALFFVALQHACRAGWSVTVRRLAELLAAPVPLLGRAGAADPRCRRHGQGNAVPLGRSASRVAGRRAAAPTRRPIRTPSSSPPRWLGYFVVWWLLARFFLRRSVQQDRSRRPGPDAADGALERAGPAAVFVTVTFASFDWLMSLEPQWFSTIYGVYYFSGAVVGFLAAMILLAVLLQAADGCATA